MNLLPAVLINMFLGHLVVICLYAGWVNYWRQRQMRLRVMPIRRRDGRISQGKTSPAFAMMPIARGAIVDSMKDGMIVLDDQHQIADINLAARQIIQQSSVNLLGAPIGKVLPAVADQILAVKSKPLDIVFSERFYEVSISPFHGGRDQQTGHLLVLRDITERKKLENSRDDMTRMMVHDLRDPISNSLFALEMLRTTLPDSSSPDAQQLLDLTFASTAKTLQLVDKILEIGRLESGELPLSLTSINIFKMVEDILAAQAPRAMNKQLHLFNDVPQSSPTIWGDAELLERVLKNLVDNSIKFTPVAGTIRVGAGQPQTNHLGEESLFVTVSDTGPGIPTDLQPQLFEQFVTGSHPESKNGLGLAFCKMALAAHGQRIWVNSESGQGTVFTFSLPTSNMTS